MSGREINESDLLKVLTEGQREIQKQTERETNRERQRERQIEKDRERGVAERGVTFPIISIK